MASERKIRRYAAYFHGWATAFGNHDKRCDERRDLTWLLSEDQVGVILTPEVKGFLDPLFGDGGEGGPPQVELAPGTLHIADAQVSFGEEHQQVFDAIMHVLNTMGDLHLLQTYHLVYPSGTRILTLSHRVPLAIIYREIDPMILRMV
jgi:hypothetical protein